MRGQNQQVDESTIAKGVSVIRAAGRPKKNIKVPEKRKLRVAAYCRVSKDIVQQEGSLETQMESFDRLISQHPDWELVEIYSDKGKTGTSTKNRAAFGKWDLYSLSMVFTIPSSIKTGSGVAGGVRISSAPG